VRSTRGSEKTIPTVDHEICAGYVVPHSLAVAGILTRKCGHATLPDCHSPRATPRESRREEEGVRQKEKERKSERLIEAHIDTV